MTTKDTGLGLPSGNSSSTPNSGGKDMFSLPEVPFIEYHLPSTMLGLGWEDTDFGERDQVFRLAEVSPEKQDHAAKIANGNQSILGRELLFAAIYQVGDWKTGRNRERLAAWWRAIGNKGRRLVEAAFVKMQSVDEVDVETFLDSGKSGIG